MTVARVNGVDLYYETRGSGRPLFLTHGSWGDATGWEGVVPRLADRFEVTIWDRRGHTRSSDGDGTGDFAQDAADLAGLIETLDRRDAFVYGSSSGGAVVLKLLEHRPGIVAAAGVHEPAVPGLLEDTADPELRRALDHQKEHLETVRRLIEAGSHMDAAEYFMDHVALGPGTWDRLPRQVKDGFAANAPTYLDEIVDMDGWTVDPEALADSSVPLMISIGTESPWLIRAVTRELIRRLPFADVETLDGLGHIPYRTAPDRWLETVVGFFSTVASKAV